MDDVKEVNPVRFGSFNSDQICLPIPAGPEATGPAGPQWTELTPSAQPPTQSDRCFCAVK